MKNLFVPTQNYRRFRAAITALQGRGAPEAGWCVVHSPPGMGKTAICNHWAVETGALHLRARATWTPTGFLRDAATFLNVDTGGRSSQIFTRLMKIVSEHGMSIVIDECEHTLTGNASTLETIRDLADMTESIVVLIGMEKALAKVSRYLQISSRINQVVAFEAATLADVSLVCEQLSDVKLAPGVIAEIHRQSRGVMRTVKNAMKLLEHLARRSGKTALDLADIEGVPLTYDWQSLRQQQRGNRRNVLAVEVAA